MSPLKEKDTAFPFQLGAEFIYGSEKWNRNSSVVMMTWMLISFWMAVQGGGENKCEMKVEWKYLHVLFTSYLQANRC